MSDVRLCVVFCEVMGSYAAAESKGHAAVYDGMVCSAKYGTGDSYVVSGALCYYAGI